MFPHLPWYQLPKISPLTQAELGSKYNFSMSNSWITQARSKSITEVFKAPPLQNDPRQISLNKRKFNVESIKYTTLSGKIPFDPAANAFHRKVFSFWISFWSDFWASSSPKPSQTDLVELFTRQDLIHCLHTDNEIIGTLFQSRYDLEHPATRFMPYFSNLDSETFNFIASLSNPYLVTHEYLTISKQWRKSQTGLSLTPALMACGASGLKSLGGKSSVAIARKDIGISQVCMGIGWKIIKENFAYKGYPCDIISLTADTESLSKEVRDLRNFFLSQTQNRNTPPTGNINPTPNYPLESENETQSLAA